MLLAHVEVPPTRSPHPQTSLSLIAGFRIPHGFYWVLWCPALLAGMSYPSAFTPWQEISAAGFHLVVCLTGGDPDYDPSPPKIGHGVQLEDLAHGNAPANPERDDLLIRGAVEVAASRLLEGERLIVHSAGATGRTGTVIGCLLRVVGLPLSEVPARLDKLNQARGKDPDWPGAASQAQVVER